MRVHRGYLFWGIFFVLLGGIPLADQLGWFDAGTGNLSGRLWPLIIIAVGVAILLSRSRIALLGTIVTAFILGTIAGSVLAGSGWVWGLGDCTSADGSALATTNQSGSFGSPARVELASSCGSLEVSPATGQTWDLHAGHKGAAPSIDAGIDRLTVRSAGGSGRQEWTVRLPMAQVQTLTVNASAIQSHLGLAGAALSGLGLTINAGDAVVDASNATMSGLDVTVNAGRAGITLGGATSGSITINAGSVDVCVPPSAALQLDVPGHIAFDTNLDERGLSQSGQTWQRDGTGPRITLTVSGNAARFDLDPAEGCG